MFKRFNVVSGGFILLLGGCGTEGATGSEVELSGYALEAAVNPAGIGESAHTSGVIDRTNPFFQALGANLRTCETCHAPGQGWTVSANATKRMFDDTDGLAPIFMIHDAGGAATMDISTLDARKAAFATTVDRGVIRFTRTISPTAEFLVASVVDPYGFSTPTSVSAFRRPSPTANESKVPATGWAGGPTDPFTQVASTSIGATRGHEQRVDPLPTETVNAMRDFQIGVVFAQSFTWLAGRLDDDGAKGGAANLLAQPFYVGINDIQGNDPMGHPFTRKVFDLYDAWASNASAPWWDVRAAARGAIYRGQEIFNNREFDISGVAGLNDVLGQTVVHGTCSTCHNAPNVGSHSVFRQFDIRRPAELRQRHPAHHPGEQDHPRTAPDLRHGPRHGHRPVERRGPLPCPAAPRSRRPRAVLPRRPDQGHQEGDQVLRRSLQHQLHQRRAQGPRGVPAGPVTRT
jgi:cytochrome c peroxidase